MKKKFRFNLLAAVGIAAAIGTVAFTTAENGAAEYKVGQKSLALTTFVPISGNQWAESPTECEPGDDFCGIAYDTNDYGPLVGGSLPNTVQSILNSTSNYESMDHGKEIEGTGIFIYRKE